MFERRCRRRSSVRISGTRVSKAVNRPSVRPVRSSPCASTESTDSERNVMLRIVKDRIDIWPHNAAERFALSLPCRLIQTPQPARIAAASAELRKPCQGELLRGQDGNPLQRSGMAVGPNDGRPSQITPGTPCRRARPFLGVIPRQVVRCIAPKPARSALPRAPLRTTERTDRGPWHCRAPCPCGFPGLHAAP